MVQHPTRKQEGMKTDIFDNFDIIENTDLKRFEFNSKTNLLTSYTVGFNEADNIEDAKISVYKAIKLELIRLNQTINEFIQKLANTGIC